MKFAIIDLGTNTFQLLIIENSKVSFKTSEASKIGKGGININLITKEAQIKAIEILKSFKHKIDAFNIVNIHAFGTSAIRNANNQTDFIAAVKEQTGINIQVISGDEEAELIYLGVKQTVEFDKNSLIVDIGGGSVEFIICDQEKIHWKKSLEIGGQRLMELFMTKDPISQSSISKINAFLRKELMPLANAVHQYHPKTLVGSSGSFDTLNEMYFQKTNGEAAPDDVHGFEYSINEFRESYEAIVFVDKEERMNIKGMISLRVEMIVVAVILINFIIENFGIEKMKISNFSLKEGAISKIQNAQ